MALAKSVIAGAIAAVAVPYIIRGGSGQLVEWLHFGIVQFSIAGLNIVWSWPLFCVVTLFTWAMLGWSNR